MPSPYIPIQHSKYLLITVTDRELSETKSGVGGRCVNDCACVCPQDHLAKYIPIVMMADVSLNDKLAR